MLTLGPKEKKTVGHTAISRMHKQETFLNKKSAAKKIRSRHFQLWSLAKEERKKGMQDTDRPADSRLRRSFSRKSNGGVGLSSRLFSPSPFFSSVLPLFDSRVETAVSRHEQVLLIFLLPDFFLTDLEMGSFQKYFYCGTFPKKVVLFDSVLELGKLSEIVLIRVKINFARRFIIRLVDKVKTGKGCVMSSFLRNSNLL